MKNVIKILVFLSVLLLVGCETTTSETTTTTISYMDLDYSDFQGQFIDDVDEQLNMPYQEYYIYYYGPNCSACIILKPEILDRFYHAKNDVIYFVAVITPDDINENVDIRYTPSLVKVIDGEVTEAYQGNTAIRGMIEDID